MRRSERGFILSELLLVIAIASILALAASMTTVQLLKLTDSNSNHTISIRDVQNAGYWISNDTQMAEIVTVGTDPETGDFLTIKWTEWGYDGADSKYHTVRYFLVLRKGVLNLVRDYQITGGINRRAVVAEHIYYNPSDPDRTTVAIYVEPLLNIQLASSVGDYIEVRKHTAWIRPEF